MNPSELLAQVKQKLQGKGMTIKSEKQVNGDTYLQVQDNEFQIHNLIISKDGVLFYKGTTSDPLKTPLKKDLSFINEMSGTGSGAAFTAGAGEQYASPKAFKKRPPMVKGGIKLESLLPKLESPKTSIPKWQPRDIFNDLRRMGLSSDQCFQVSAYIEENFEEKGKPIDNQAM